MSETIPGAPFDQLATWMRQRVAVKPPLTAERVGDGQSNLIYRLQDAAGSQWVLRRPPVGEILDSAHDVAREARILTALAGSEVPIPPIVGLVAPGELPVAAAAAPLLIMGFVSGVTVDGPSAKALDEQDRVRLSKSMAAALAAVHAVDLDQTGLTTLASHKPYAARQLRRWRTQWERSRTRDHRRVDDLAQRLHAAAPAHEELSLVHGDFHLKNVIASPQGEVLALLDWELCTLGDPLADLGSMLAYWPEPGEPGIEQFSEATLPGFPPGATVADEYARLTDRNLDALAFWHALGLWKLAIIAEGVHRRALDRGLPQAISRSEIDSVIDRADRAAKNAGI